MDDHLGAVAGQLQGDRAADAGRRARHEGLLTLEVTRLGRRHCCSPNVVVHKPLGAHNSVVSVMVPDHAFVDPSGANTPPEQAPDAAPEGRLTCPKGRATLTGCLRERTLVIDAE